MFAPIYSKLYYGLGSNELHDVNRGRIESDGAISGNYANCCNASSCCLVVFLSVRGAEKLVNRLTTDQNLGNHEMGEMANARSCIVAIKNLRFLQFVVVAYLSVGAGVVW